MILNRIHLKPFGGLSDTSLDFNPNLNVIQGPNEAGKSTIFNAIFKALFVQTNLRMKVFEKEIKNYIPIGGDICRVFLHMRQNGEEIELNRSWGSTSGSELKLKNGALLTNEETIFQNLDNLLPAKEGTFRTVLMTYQSQLPETVKNIKLDSLQSLGDILNKAILETDGVSIDLLRQLVVNKYTEQFGRWDRSMQKPEGNKGVNDQWTRGAGGILKAYYEKEEQRVAFEEAISYEEDYDKLNKRLQSIEESIEKSDKFITDNKSLFNSISTRKVLEAQIESTATKFKTYEEVNNVWPVFERDLKKLKNDVPALEKRLKDLKAEHNQAEAFEKSKNLLERFKRVESKKKIMNQLQQELLKTKKLTEEEYEELNKIDSDMKRLESQLSAGKLSVIFKSKKSMEIGVQSDIDETKKRKVQPGKPMEIKAGGRIKLEHSDWSLNVVSGDEDIEKLETLYIKSQESFNNLIKKHKVKTLIEAEKTYKIYYDKLQEFKRAESNFEEELGQDSYKELDKQVKELGQIKQGRELGAIIKESSDKEHEIKDVKNKIGDIENKIESYIKEYENKESLFLKVAKTMDKKVSYQNELKILPELPKDIKNPDEFAVQYENIKEESANLKTQKTDCKYEIADLHEREPVATAQELERATNEAKEIFKLEIKRGEHLQVIKEEVEELVSTFDNSGSQDLQKDMEAIISYITKKKYKKIQMKDNMPEGFLRKDDNLIPYELLSTGTKDVLGLALRLAMAKYFLQNANGFFIMDDPLVDMDPERQKMAVDIIKKFAEDKQTIVFTCHPTHAKMLDNNPILL